MKSNLKGKVLIAGVICSSMIMIGIQGVFAASTDITTPGSTNVPITAKIASQFTVTIPKDLDITSGAANYSIQVAGDIESNKKLKVEPSSVVEMTEVNAIKTSVNATVTQTKKEWTYTDVANSLNTNGSITASLTAGTWAGILAFNVTLE